MQEGREHSSRKQSVASDKSLKKEAIVENVFGGLVGGSSRRRKKDLQALQEGRQLTMGKGKMGREGQKSTTPPNRLKECASPLTERQTREKVVWGGKPKEKKQLLPLEKKAPARKKAGQKGGGKDGSPTRKNL